MCDSFESLTLLPMIISTFQRKCYFTGIFTLFVVSSFRHFTLYFNIIYFNIFNSLISPIHRCLFYCTCNVDPFHPGRDLAIFRPLTDSHVLPYHIPKGYHFFSSHQHLFTKLSILNRKSQGNTFYNLKLNIETNLITLFFSSYEN